MKKFLIVSVCTVIALMISSCAQVPEVTPTALPPEVQPTDTPTLAPTVEPTEALPVEIYQLTLGFKPFLADAPFFFAQELGFFTDQGLEVELIRFSKAEDMIAPLAAGQLDVASAFPTAALFNGIARGGKMSNVGAVTYLNPDTCGANALVTTLEILSSGKLDDPVNWKGLRIGMSAAGDIMHYSLETLLTQNGLTIEDVEIEEIPNANRMDALDTGAAEVVLVTEPGILRIQQAGIGDTWKTLGSILPDYTFGMLQYGPAILEKPEIGQRFMLAYLEAVATINEGKTDSNVAIMAKHTGLSEQDIRDACWPSFVPDGYINTKSLMEYQAWAVEKGYVTEPITEEQLWDPQFVEYANEQMK